MPAGSRVFLVSINFSGGDCIGQRPFVGNAPIKALRRQDTEIGFSHVQPTSMFAYPSSRYVSPLVEAFIEPAARRLAAIGTGEDDKM